MDSDYKFYELAEDYDLEEDKTVCHACESIATQIIDGVQLCNRHAIIHRELKTRRKHGRRN